MTIYKTLPNEKKTDKELGDAEVATEPLTGEKEEGVTTPKIVRVTYNPNRTKTFVNLCLIVTALLVLGAGIIGAVFLYRHLAQRVYQIHCRQYYDKPYQKSFHDYETLGDDDLRAENLQRDKDIAGKETDFVGVQMDYFEEDIEVSEVDKYERLEVPKFDECDETVVWHDFEKNYTAIVDHHLKLCYIMKLNRTLIAPPRDMIDLIAKFKNKYYLPRADIVREKYRVATPAISDLTVLGTFIMRACYWYETYHLERIVGGVYRRSVEPQPSALQSHFMFSTFKNNVVYNMTVVRPLPAQKPAKGSKPL